MRTYHKISEERVPHRSDSVRTLREAGLEARNREHKQMTHAGLFWVWYVVSIVVILLLVTG